ncbi:hypothetical protein BaRGS_00017681 [Batillaria attramentaria]|uniref:Uncharacterized protein n=1 Tax=Batillaria attramentaria TaxID=370345 RepID=A0ABD0KV45_9CAEN
MTVAVGVFSCEEGVCCCGCSVVNKKRHETGPSRWNLDILRAQVLTQGPQSPALHPFMVYVCVNLRRVSRPDEHAHQHGPQQSEE